MRPSFMPNFNPFYMKAYFNLRDLLLLTLVLGVSELRCDTVDGVAVTVLSRTPIIDGSRTITFVRIRPPSLPTKTPATLGEPGDRNDVAERTESKESLFLELTATVYLQPPVVTKLTWRSTDREWVLWSNIDFRLLTPLHQWESTTTVYSWFPMVFEHLDQADDRPKNLNLAAGPAEYLIVGNQDDVAAHAADFMPFDFLHAYHDLHRAELIAELARRERLNEELQRRAAAAKKQPKDETIFFWKNAIPASNP